MKLRVPVLMAMGFCCTAYAADYLGGFEVRDCGGDEFAKVRTCEFGGKTYFYVINTDRNPRMVSFDFPEGTIEILTGKSLLGNVHLHLAAYELRSYVRGAVRQEAR